MKKYNVNNLKVVRVNGCSNSIYFICKYNKMTDTYIEILTNEKFKIYDKECIESLSNYYSNSLLSNGETEKNLMVDRRSILQKYIEINSGMYLGELEKADTSNAILEKSTLEFFPKTGHWYSSCFKKPTELSMANLPCHLRDDAWLAKMFKKQQSLFYMSNSKVLSFVKTSSLFKEKRHEYELEIVKWQINWIAGHGENWICDDNYGGDFVYLSPAVDLGVRKGVVDTLSNIGMNKDVIEEGIEKFADLWREPYMESAFRNEYEPVFFMSFEQVEPAEEEHKQKWLQMRRYEYYQRHKKSVDLYGVVSSDMLMTDKEVDELRIYLDKKHQERKQHIEDVKNVNSRTVKKIKLVKTG